MVLAVSRYASSLIVACNNDCSFVGEICRIRVHNTQSSYQLLIAELIADSKHGMLRENLKKVYIILHNFATLEVWIHLLRSDRGHRGLPR